MFARRESKRAGGSTQYGIRASARAAAYAIITLSGNAFAGENAANAAAIAASSSGGTTKDIMQAIKDALVMAAFKNNVNPEEASAIAGVVALKKIIDPSNAAVVAGLVAGHISAANHDGVETASSIAAQLDINAEAAGDAVWLISPDTGATVTWAAARDALRLAFRLILRLSRLLARRPRMDMPRVAGSTGIASSVRARPSK